MYRGLDWRCSLIPFSVPGDTAYRSLPAAPAAVSIASMADVEAVKPSPSPPTPLTPTTPTSTQALVLADFEDLKAGGGGGGVSSMVQNGNSCRASKGALSDAGGYKTYRRRWFILVLFVIYSMSNAFQWIQYSIINNIITRYYGVEARLVDWCSMIYMIVYIPLIFPASWFLEKKGLRHAVLLGSFGTMVGAWIKCASVAPDRFMVTFGGQFVAAVSQIFILGIPARLAAVWFGAGQVSTACAIGVFGNQLGVALGFLIPPMLVPDSGDPDEIAQGLYTMFFSNAGLCTVLFLLIMLFFKEKPPTPPSAAAESAEAEGSGSYVGGIVRLVKNRGYVLLLLSYGINVGAFYAISTLLNQVVLLHFPGETVNAGRIGLLIVLSGMMGSVVCGLVLDKTAKFKLVTLVVYIMSLTFMLAYTFIFKVQVLALVFVMAGALGFFMTGYLPVGFEFAAELTFPEPEGTSSGLLNASAQFFGIICTLADGALLNSLGDQAANLLLVGVLAVGAVMTAIIKEDLRRQRARLDVPVPDTSM